MRRARRSVDANAEAAPPAPEIWSLWRRLVADYRTSRQLAVALRSGVAWGVYGVDRVGVLRESELFRVVEQTTAGLDRQTLDTLIDIAEVNAERNDALWRLAVMFYISLPGAVIFASLDAAPDILRELVTASGWLLLAIFLVFTTQMAWYLMTFWRARQFVALLNLVRINRFGGRRP